MEMLSSFQASPDYILALTTGFLGSLGHCVGMCGPLVASFAFLNKDNNKNNNNSLPDFLPNFFPQLLYNTGRITTYAMIGALMGFTGSFVNVAGKLVGIQNTIAIAAGVFIILMGLSISGVMGSMKFLEKHNSFILNAAKRVLKKGTVFRYYLLGLLFGMLPCGFSFTIFIAAAATGSMSSGMLLMLFFGIGTTPALLLFGSLISYSSQNFRSWAYKTGGIVIILMGVLFLMRGLHGHASM